MKPRARSLLRVAALLAGLSSALVVEARGQGFGVRLERGEIGLDGRGLHQVSGVSPGAVTSDYQQWLRLPLSGFMVHPRVLRYTFALRPLYGQHLSSTEGQGNRTSSLGLDASLTAFSARRMSLSFQSTRSSGSSRGELGADSDFDNEGYTGVLRFRDRYFPVTVTYSDRTVRDRWRSPFSIAPIERDQRSSRLRGEIRNRRLTTIYEQTRYRDHRGTGDHDSRSVQARHRITWGKGSSLMSSVNFYSRAGSSAVERVSWSERALIAHTSSVSTSLSYSQQSWSRETSGGRNVSYDVTSRYSPALSVEAALSVSGQRFRTQGEGDGLHRLRIAPSARYVLALPSEVRLHLSGAVGAERLSRSLPSDFLVNVVEERYEVDADRVFPLNEVRVESASIEIWTEDRTLLLVEGVDYRVVEVGGFTEIQILPGSRVTEGEVVLVSYRYRTLAVEDTDLLYMNYETTLRRFGFSVRHGRRQRSEDVTSGSATVNGPDDVDTWYGLTYTTRTRFGGVRLEGMHRSRDASEIEYRTREYRVDVDPPAMGSVDTRFRASTSRTEAGDQVTRTTTAGSSLSWPVSRSLTVTGGLDGWIWGRRGQSTERFLAGHAMVTWRFGQVNAFASFDQIRRSNGLGRTENRWSLRLVRRF